MNATETITASLTTALREAIEYDDSNGDLAAHITRALLKVGAEVEIVSDDPDEEDYSEGNRPRDRKVATTQVHRILVDGVEVANLEREGWSYYGSIDHPNTPSGEWTTDSGENDHQPSNAWLAVAKAADLSGDWEYYPGADEVDTAEPETDDEGEYCLWWITVGDDSGPLTAKRYSSLDDARAACQLADHELHRKHRGTLLCGYGIAQLVDGEWSEYSDDSE